MNVWLDTHEVPADRFAVELHGCPAEPVSTPKRAAARLAELPLGKRDAKFRRAAGRVVGSLFAKRGHLLVEAEPEGAAARVTVTAVAFGDPGAVVPAVEGIANRLRPVEVDLVGCPGERSSRRPYSADGLVFLRGLERVTSPFQTIEVAEHPAFGRVLLCNGEVQIASSDEPFYSATLAGMAVRKRTRRVLIMGGGDCGVLREVLARPWVEEVVMAEIDERVIELTARHFPEVVADAREDPRTRIVIGDAFAHIRDEGGYDAIVYDISDTPLELDSYGEVFPLVRAALAPRGRLAVQCGSGLDLDRDRLRDVLTSLEASFSKVSTKNVDIPSFVQPWVFAAARR